MRTTYCGLVSEALLGQTVTLMGWAHRRRDHGGVIFIDLRDREGLVQVVCDPDRAETFKTAEGVRSEYCLQVVGKVRARPAGTENPNLPTGMIEVLTQTLEILNPSLTPPFQIDDDNINVCNADCGGYTPAPCPGGQICVDDACVMDFLGCSN